MTTMTAYVEHWQIDAEVVKDRGAQIEDGWEHHSYRVQLRNGLTGAVTPAFDWKQGYAIEDSPEDRPDAILDALVSDAWSYETADSFEDFAAEFGYDEDSRKAEKIYNACGEVAAWLDEFLGGDLELVATTIDRL
jgi:hypothetical protein